MGLPQIIIIGLFSMSAGMHLVKHGEYKGDRYNFFVELIAGCIMLLILYWGGFFTEC